MTSVSTKLEHDEQSMIELYDQFESFCKLLLNC